MSRLLPHLRTLPTVVGVGPYALLAAGILNIEVTTGGAGVVTTLWFRVHLLLGVIKWEGTGCESRGSRGTVYAVARVVLAMHCE